MCFLACDGKPPDKVQAKGMAGAHYGAFYGMQNNPNEFALGLMDAPGKETSCCLLGTLGGACGFTACWARQTVLDTLHNGIQDFRCFQGYIPACCCMDLTTCFPGSAVGLYLEGCCCPMMSLSIARIHLMDTKGLRPDPMDWKIIHFSNCLQLVSCIVHIAASIADVQELDQAAMIIDIIADVVTLSVAGCMAGQVNYELKKAGPTVTANGAPAQVVMARN